MLAPRSRALTSLLLLVALLFISLTPLFALTDSTDSTSGPARISEKATARITKFGNIKPLFFFNRTDVSSGHWTFELLTSDYHTLVPHNPNFQPGFVPESYPEVDPDFIVSSSYHYPCGTRYLTDPNKPLTSIYCTHVPTYFSSVEFYGISIALLPNKRYASQPFPQARFRIYDNKSSTPVLEIDYTFDEKPFGVSDFQDSACSQCVFTGANAYLNQTADNQMQVAFTINSHRQNRPDLTFSVELLGDRDDDYIFVIDKYRSPDTQITPMYIQSHNTTISQATMILSNQGRSLNLTSVADPLPSGQNFVLSLPFVYVVQNPDRSGPALTTPPRFRMASRFWQADVDYSLNFIPLLKGLVEPAELVEETSPTTTATTTTTQTTDIPLAVFVPVVAASALVIIALAAKLFFTGKALEKAEKASAEPLLSH